MRSKRLVPLIVVSLGVLVLTSSAQAAGGTVMGWGYNPYGSVGSGTTDDQPTPTQAVGLSGVVQVAAGEYHSMAVRADGTVAGWGYNYYGEAIGVTSPEEVLVPTPVAGLSNVVEVALGDEHSLALLADGTVMAWGENEAGQLGVGTTNGPEFCGSSACARQPTPVPGLANVIAISAGEETSLALLADGTVMAWGYDFYGSLGRGIGVSSGCQCSDHPIPVAGVTGAVAISMGLYHGMALLEDGTVKAWGYNQYAEVGNGTATESTGCYCVSAVAPVGIANAKEISAAPFHSLAVLADGTVWGWGANDYGQLGIGNKTGPEICDVKYPCSRVPVQVPGLAGVKTAGGGELFGNALLPGGAVKSWGNNEYGELGDSTKVERLSPVTTIGIFGASDLVGGPYTALAIVGPSQTLNVEFAGAGSGRVGTAGLVCPASNCSETFAQGQVRNLRASSTSGGFAGFSGPCAGTGTCQVRMDTDQTVTATFGVPKGTAITSSDVDSKTRRASFAFSAPGAITGYECKLVRPAVAPKKAKKKRRKGGKHKGKGHRLEKPKKKGRKPKPKPKPQPPAAFAPCTSPAAFADLTPGAHTFEVRALDILGADATPAVEKFAIEKPKPKKKKKKKKGGKRR